MAQNHDGQNLPASSPVAPLVEAPLLNPTTLDELFKLEEDTGPGLVQGIADLFFAGTLPKIQRMRQAVSTPEASVLFREAHTLKSSCGYLGAESMQQLCARIDALGRTGVVEGAGPLIDLLEAEYRRLRPALEERLGARLATRSGIK